MQDDAAAEQDVLGVPASERVLHSDPHDFAGLYIRHRASFTLHARRYLRDARDADEVVQEAFLRLFLALPELETELQALAYCRRTITNLCIDRYRAQARRPSLVDLDSAGAMDLAEDDPGDPVVRAEDAAMVRAALSLLSPLHRAALVKREIEEKPLPVIAEELEIAEESVKHVLFRARRALRRILATTSLAPGSDAELAGALGKVMRSSSGGLTAFLLLLVLGLGTGPDLRAIPVVGSDLPDLIPVTEIASAMGTVVNNVASAVADAGPGKDDGGRAGGSDTNGGAGAGDGATLAERPQREDVSEPLAVPEPSRSSSPRPAPKTGSSPAGAASAPQGSASPAAAMTTSESTGTESTAGGSPSPGASGSPSPDGSPSPSPTTSPDREPSESPTSSPSPSPTATKDPSPSSSPNRGRDRRVESRPSESPSPSAEAQAG